MIDVSFSGRNQHVPQWTADEGMVASQNLSLEHQQVKWLRGTDYDQENVDLTWILIGHTYHWLHRLAYPNSEEICSQLINKNVAGSSLMCKNFHAVIVFAQLW